MLFNALAALGHRGIKTTATFGRAGLMLFNAVSTGEKLSSLSSESPVAQRF